MHISNLQIPGLFAQQTDPGHIRLQLPPVITQHTDSNDRPLPFILTGHLGNRGVEAGTQTIFQAAHGTTLILQGPGPWNHQFDGEQGDQDIWSRHGIDRLTVGILETVYPIKPQPLLCSDKSILSPNQAADNDRGPARMIVAIIGISILAISIIGGMLLACRNASDRQRQTKILFFALYFWVLTFMQLIVVAIGYSVLNK